MNALSHRSVFDRRGTLQPGQSRQEGWLAFLVSSVMAMLFGSVRRREKFPVERAGSGGLVKKLMAGFAKLVLLLSVWSFGTFAYADLVTLKPTAYPSKICSGQSFDVTFGVESTSIINKMYAWLSFDPVLLQGNTATGLVTGGTAMAEFASLGAMVFTAPSSTLNVPAGNTNLFTFNFTPLAVGTTNLTFQEDLTWSKRVDVDPDIDMPVDTLLPQVNQELQLIVENCGGNPPGPNTLTVTKVGTATGTVTSISAGINCGEDCTEEYPLSAQVTLIASPISTFAGWSGDCTGISTTTTVTMDTAKNCIATFGEVPPNCNANVLYSELNICHLNHIECVFNDLSNCDAIKAECDDNAQRLYGLCYKLNIAKVGNGTVTSTGGLGGTLDCGSTCSDYYAFEDKVTLTATTGVTWTGACSGTASSCVVTIPAAIQTDVTATFSDIPAKVRLDVTKTGNGTVSSTPTGINCGTDCNESYSSSTTVSLNATPSTDNVFKGWTGSCSGSNGTVSVTMDAAKNCTATFEVANNDAVYERFAGLVVDQDGKPLAGATVKVNGVEKQTGSDGSFEVYVAKDDRYVVNAVKSGYALVSQIENNLYGNANLKLTVKKADVIEINPSIKNTVADSRDTQIVLPADALVDANGNKPTGTVNVLMYTYDLANEPMPGDMGGIDSSGRTVYLESAGAFFAEFTDALGKKYNLATGQKATISVPAISTPRTTVDLWSYDETNGVWRQEGAPATLVNGRFVGEVSHFSVWNLDWPGESGPSCVEVTIEPSFFDAYKNASGILTVKVIARKAGIAPQVTREGSLGIGTHVFWDLPEDATVEIYAPSTSTNPFTVSAGAAWGGIDQPPSIDGKYPQCNGKITLTSVKIDDGFACLYGKGEGKGFSWKLMDASGVLIKENLSASTTAGDDSYNIAGKFAPLELGIYSIQGECIDLGGKKLYVGPAGGPANCEVTAIGCQFNPIIKLVSKKQLLSSIRGVLWGDLNSNSLQDSNEGYLEGWTVFLKSPDGSETSKVTDAKGYYEFTNLSTGDHTVLVETRADVTYTTPQSVVRKVSLVTIPRTVNFAIKEVPKFNLAVDKVGIGTVASTPAGIICGVDCTEDYKLDTDVQLTAIARLGYSFKEWTGSCIGNVNPITVKVDAAKNCTAIFQQKNVVNTVACSGVTDGLVACYSFDGNANDMSVNALHGEERGGLSYVDGIKGQAILLDGIDDYVNVKHSQILNVNHPTVTAWVNADPTAPSSIRTILGKTYPFRYATIELDLSGPYLRSAFVKSSDGTMVGSAHTLTYGEWHFVVATYDGAHAKLYIDGALDVDVPRTGDLPTTAYDLTIGRLSQYHNDNQKFKGMIDEVRIYNRALTDAEIGELYSDPPVELAIGYQVNLQQAKSKGSWTNTDLAISLGTKDVAKSYLSTANASGEGTLTLADVPTNDDYFCVKNSHTLANKIVQTYPKVGNRIDFGTLWEGDAIEDNILNINDASFIASKAKCYTACQPNLPASCTAKDFQQSDLNVDGCVNPDDVKLFQSNFKTPNLKTSECGLKPTGMYRKGQRGVREDNQQAVSLGIVVPSSLIVGTPFDYTVQVNATESQPINAAAVYLNFDPTKLQVNRISTGESFDFTLDDAVDNTKGQINFAALVLDKALPTQTVDLAIINFTALQAGEQTITFSNSAKRKTMIAYAGEDIMAFSENGKIIVEPIATAGEYTASGQLLGRTGIPLGNVTIHIGEKTTTTDAAGNWSLSGLTAGKYDIVATKGKQSCVDSEIELLGNGQYQQRVNYACDVVTYSDDNASFIAIWQSVDGNLQYVDTVSVEDFDAKFQEHRDYEIVDSNGEYLLEGLDDAGITTSKIEVVRIR